MYYVYILTNWNNKVLYVGFTSDVHARIAVHRAGPVDGFTKKYRCTKLVYFEAYDDYDAMLAREKEIKKWRREKKNALIAKINVDWRDLYDEL